ncbi:hypothetical protein KHC28_16845 [Ancylobacter sonchi]|uniref:hypothetical protein n=1 Tax=Ancylobacter sonchi TaxID=1937790 RepID=UPI001BD32887|nr:hypothetical protein [Ancylobacter sonchi]MBS7535323.1 hypothetical protein [Ancylobacter sonchi]
MRFSANRLYIESYEKCPNCGVLLYDTPSARASWVVQSGKTYCSQWCVTWEADRAARRASAPAS